MASSPRTKGTGVRPPAQGRPNARREFGRRERLDHVVVGAGLQCPRDGLVAPVARDEDDRQVGEFRHGLHQLDAVGPWQHQVEQDQPGLFCPDEARQLPGVALVRGCGQADALQTVEPVTDRCGTRRVCQARSSGSERDTRARPHAVAPMNGVPEDSRRRSTCTGRTHAPRARADGTQTPSSTVAVRAPSPS